MIPRPTTVRPFYIVATADEVEPGAEPPVPSPELLAAFGSTPDEIASLAERPFHTAIMAEAPIEEAATAERECRRAAFAFAVEYDGIVVDAAVPRILGMQREFPRLTAATNWFVFERDGDAVSTVGLHRFGLPELSCLDAAGPMFDAVLTGLAQRLLRDWPATDPVGPLTVTLRDIAYGYGDKSAGGEDPAFARSLDLTIAYDEIATVLDVTLYDDPAQTLFTDR